MKEFKVGDKCYVEWEIIDTNNSKTFPIRATNLNGRSTSFTFDGLSISDDVFPALKHIEDIIPEPEFPKWMLIKGNNGDWVKRKVIYKDETGYVYINFEFETVNRGVGWCKESDVKEIEPENPLKLELLTKADELHKKAQELIQKAQELKEQANKL